MRRPLLLLLAFVLVQLPWLARPIHYDEANFMTLARGARADLWRPHAVAINWQGTTEPAFDVLSNPPGIAWFLAPVYDAPVPVQRAWMLLWLPLALYGGWQLGRRYLDNGAYGAAILLSSPVVLLATPSLLPDAPLYALTLAGVGGYVRAVAEGRPVWGWALLAGCGALFRYSALPLAPLLAAHALYSRRTPWGGLAAFVPILLLAGHDLHAYGRIHLLAMGSFQAVANTPLDLSHKFVASIAMLGGAAALPAFRWTRWSIFGALVGAAAGAAWGPVGAGFAALGGASLGEVARRARHAVFLTAWAVAGLAFLLTLRFSATRYWLPFLPAVLLLAPVSRVRVVSGFTLGLALLADEYQSAEAQEELAEAVTALGVGGFTGHWGWQWALERRGWIALESGAKPADGMLVAMPQQAWPQSVEVSCQEVEWSGEALPPYPWLPRGYTQEGEANLHASWIAGPPPQRTIAPWWFATDPYEQARVCRE